jgi:hypothetical protein
LTRLYGGEHILRSRFRFHCNHLDIRKDLTDGWQVRLNRLTQRVFADQNQALDLCFCSQFCHGAGIAVIDDRCDVGPVIRQVNFTLLFSPKICTTPLPDQAI